MVPVYEESKKYMDEKPVQAVRVCLDSWVSWTDILDMHLVPGFSSDMTQPEDVSRYIHDPGVLSDPCIYVSD